MEKNKNVKTADKNPSTKNDVTTEREPRFSSAMETFVEQFNTCDVRHIKTDLQNAESLFRSMSDRDLTLGQRRRKVGAGIRNYGFIVKVSELAVDNPQFASLFNLEVLQNCLFNFEESRNINLMAQSLARLTSNSMLTYSDEAYSLALIFYNSVKELARRGNVDAITLFRTLQPFFRRRNTEKESKPPTEHEVERDVKALLHGHKEGEVIIRNEADHVVKGERTIVDETHKNRGSWESRENGEIN